MTTNATALRRPNPLDRLAERRAGAIERAEAEARVKRLVLVGTLASFVAFFGLAAASDIAAPEQPAAGPNVIVQYRGLPSQADVRTRSS
jgi:hypothetical protein